MASEARVRNCAFVMLDVLGFKAKLNGPGRADEFRRFVAVVEELKSAFDSRPSGDINDLLRRPDERALLYSDTLIYWQDIGPEIPAPDALVSAAAFTMRTICAGLENGFLLRGAIAVGELLTCEVPEAIGGPVVNECALHYELGNWCGCHLAPSAATVLESTPSHRQHRTGPRFVRCRMPIVSKTGATLFSEQWVVRWLDYQAESLPQHAQYLFDGPLKEGILSARLAGQDERSAVRRYFVEFMRRYAEANPAAREKISATLATIAPDFSDGSA